MWYTLMKFSQKRKSEKYKPSWKVYKMRTLEEIQQFAQMIVVGSAKLENPITAPVQVKTAIELAFLFEKEWANYAKDHKDDHKEQIMILARVQCQKAFEEVNKIQAIKECRASLGLGLKEAKDQVEAWEKEYGWKQQNNSRW